MSLLKNPPVRASELPERCRNYLEETPYLEWKFTDFWDGDEHLLSGCGDIWLRALQKIIDTTDDKNKSLAAGLAKTRYKNREHLPESSRNKGTKSKGSSKKRKKDPKPPVYESSQEVTPIADPPNRYPKRRKSREQPPTYESSQEATPVADPPNPYSKRRKPREQQRRELSVDQKWVLPSGRFVEDLLLEWAQSQADKARRLKQVPKEVYAHSLILDVDDPDVQKLFGEDWGSIVSLLLPLPEADDSLTSFMHEFVDVKTTTDLRDRLESTSYKPPGEPYSREKHGDQAWVHSVLTSLLVLYELDHMSCKGNLEAWFQINIWGPIFDRCFQYIPKMSIARSESQSPSNCRRKNSNKPSTQDPVNSNLADQTSLATKDTTNSDQRSLTSERKVAANKYDGLITHNSIEYGAVEDSKKFQEETAKKWISDSLKLAKVLHDQMRYLEERVKHDREALGKFQCVGFVTAGLHCRGLYLQYGKGHVSLLRRSKKCEVPVNVSPMADLIAVLVVVWQIRETVRRSIHNLEEFLESHTEMLFQAAVKQPPPIPAILPTCFDTDAEL